MASFAGSIPLDDKVIKINPIDAESGDLALATPNAVSGLRNGNKTNGVILAVTVSGCRIFKPATNKGAHKSWDDFLCDSAAVVKTEGRGYSLVGLFGDGNARAFSIPGLKEIGCSAINNMVDMRRLSESTVCSNGTALVWTGPSEIGLFSVWGSGIPLYESPLSTELELKLDGLLMFSIGNVRMISFSTSKLSFPHDLLSRTSSGFLVPNTSLQLIWISLVRTPGKLLPLVFGFEGACLHFPSSRRSRSSSLQTDAGADATR